MVGLGRFELPTSRLSGVRSNQLSYRPSAGMRHTPTPFLAPPGLSKLNSSETESKRSGLTTTPLRANTECLTWDAQQNPQVLSRISL